ncbi:MAG TPA: beta-ketoacyl-ACP synthase II [Candidatus Eisenbacteria bacterium]|jgi:3-oxoacyl-[acyl-carrier-protein] synthase II|nr:beta-ketoacyl-ACP synthase II [Candidatus Eisenbacteria bacterium]
MSAGRNGDGRVVVTGMGMISPLGHNAGETWQKLVEGASGVACVTRFDAGAFSTRIAAEVKNFVPEDYMDRKDAKRNDRFVQLGIAAAKEAVADARLDWNVVDPDRVGVIIGSGIGGIETFEAQHKTYLERGPDRVSPFFIPMMISNMASGQVSIHTGAKGPNFTTVSACTSSANALGEALRLLQHRDADVMIAGGTEATITPMAFAGFCSMKAMSTRNDEPQRASRPFDRDRDGFVMGEGAAVLILEREEHARRRGAPILCEIAGYGASGDAYHITSPTPGGDGAARSMERALLDAGLSPSDIQYINAHGTSTLPNDRTETTAVKRVFGENAQRVMLASTKSMTGHLLGAAGAMEAAVCSLVIAKGVVPPTINYENPDPECDLDCVPNRAREVRVTAALSNSMGFGGHNATLAFRAMTT